MGSPQVSIGLDSVGGSIMSDFTRDNQDKLMATLFVEYKDSGRKDANGRAILVKDEKVINVAKFLLALVANFVLPVSVIQRKLVNYLYYYALVH